MVDAVTVAEKPKHSPKPQHPDRITLSADAFLRVSEWSKEAALRLKGVKLTRSDLVNFLVLAHEETLSEAELERLEARYFDEVKFAYWAAQEVKAARARGETITLAEILAQNRLAKSDKTPSQRRSLRRSKKAEKPEKNAQNSAESHPQESLNLLESTSGK